ASRKERSAIGDLRSLREHLPCFKNVGTARLECASSTRSTAICAESLEEFVDGIHVRLWCLRFRMRKWSWPRRCSGISRVGQSGRRVLGPSATFALSALSFPSCDFGQNADQNGVTGTGATSTEPSYAVRRR